MTEVIWQGAEALRPFLVLIDDLEPFPDNPNQGNVEAVRASFQRFGGQVAPVIADPPRIVAGHTRVEAARAEGWTHIAVIPNDFGSDDEARAYLLADNRTAELSTTNDEALAVNLQALRERSTLEGTGYTDDDRATLERSLAAIRRAAAPATPTDVDDIPDVPDEPTSVLGEIYELGPHRLMCGDSTDADQVARLMDGGRADVVFMDPPYAIYGSSTGLSESVTDDKIVRPFFRDALRAAERSTKLFGHVYVCCDWRSWSSWWEVARGGHLAPKNLLIWDKGSAGMGNNWANTYEMVGFFVLMPEQKTMSGNRKTGMRPVLSPNVIRANRVAGAEREHNAAKPVDLIEHIVGYASDEGESVLDLFGGSGSTLIAAERLGRRAFLMEIDPGWCDVIRARYARYEALTDDEKAARVTSRPLTLYLSADQERTLRERDLDILRKELGTASDTDTILAAVSRLARDLNR